MISTGNNFLLDNETLQGHRILVSKMECIRIKHLIELKQQYKLYSVILNSLHNKK